MKVLNVILIDVFVGYVQEPSGRGTSSLVISCLVTLVLCVWSALHLNVPNAGRTASQTFLLNVRWIITGIYAPELVVFTAWRQWCSAKLLRDAASRSLSASLKTSCVDRDRQWTMVHSFFACTGGFAFEINSLSRLIRSHQGSEDDGRSQFRLTLTAKGVALLAECGHLPHVPEEEIRDKSKANDLAKATVILQASWMLLQVVGRLYVRLPVTLLEVNTVAHVLCAFAMYIFWWNKPLLPKEPIVLRDKDLAPLAAYMYASSELSGTIDLHHVKSQTRIKTLFARLSLYCKAPELDGLAIRSPTVKHTEANNGGNDPLPPNTLPTDSTNHSWHFRITRSSSDYVRALRKTREKEAGSAFFERRPMLAHAETCKTDTIPLTRSQVEQWGLLGRAIQRYPNLTNSRTALSHTHSSETCLHLKSDQLVATHIQNWPWNDLLRDVDGLVVGMVLWFANFCYGGIHAAAWNERFPSRIEGIFWRISACYIGFCGGLWVVLNYLVLRSKRLNEFWERWMDGEKALLQSVGLALLVFICGFSLILARVFIVVEAFVSLRRLPAAAYQTPQWADVFPHL
ncbi:hypothetical protein K461DRAFT_287323 [Myriangium duriaei CBS 260.36]|uniref:Uncharacterized protein n=1 Tax=Myriangium duriaei CBS 260.36 TaxID=1168546 RepID=A0A9P4IZF6_9PEZI|nr:hypothetical protein K461DRAFT_287323 [Myriangium duriaei CBS 260.36]